MESGVIDPTLYIFFESPFLSGLFFALKSKLPRRPRNWTPGFRQFELPEGREDGPGHGVRDHTIRLSLYIAICCSKVWIIFSVYLHKITVTMLWLCCMIKILNSCSSWLEKDESDVIPTTRRCLLMVPRPGRNRWRNQQVEGRAEQTARSVEWGGACSLSILYSYILFIDIYDS